MKKRVAHLINSNIYSGLENVVCTIISELNDSFEMVYVTQTGPIVSILEENNIPYFIIDKMNPREIKRFINEWQPDILHAHDYTASVICSLLHTELPIINHLHHNSPWLKKICLNSVMYLYAGLMASKILTVSASIEREFIFSKFIKNKINVISNPVCRKKILDQVINENTEKEYDICCVGRLTQPKNPMRFLRIVKEIKEHNPTLKVIWVGDGELKDSIVAEVKKLKIEKNVDFVGFQKNPYQYMNKAKIFMLTSAWEGYGLVAFEALTLGLPAVVSNVGGLVDIVDDECGLLCENDRDFINEVNNLLNSNNYLKEKSLNAIEKSKKIENIDKYITDIKNIYTNKL